MSRRAGHLAGELMAQNSAETHVSPGDLDIGRTNARQANAHESFIRRGFGERNLAHGEARVIQPQGDQGEAAPEGKIREGIRRQGRRAGIRLLSVFGLFFFLGLINRTAPVGGEA